MSGPRRSPPRAAGLLAGVPGLRAIAGEVRAQATLLAGLRAQLPESVREHLVYAQLHDGRLILHADAPIWASRLRFLGPALAAGRAAETLSMRGSPGWEIRVIPRAEPRAPARREPSGSAAGPRAAAAGIVDVDLRRACLKIAAARERQEADQPP